MRFLVLTAVAITASIPVVADASVLISEVAWMGSTEDANAEWIELYNNGAAVDLEGWTLNAVDGQPNIALVGTLPANSYALFERSDDSTVAGIEAFQTYAGALGNTGEILELHDAGGMLIDRVDGSNDWAIGGDNTTKETLQRSGNPATGSWMTGVANPDGVTPLETTEPKDEDEEPSPSPSSGGSVLYGEPPEEDEVVMRKPALTLDVGEDRAVTVGVPTNFLARAYKESHKEIVVNDIDWNFGDGGTAHGREVTHTYHYPGDYIVSVVGRRNQFRNEIVDHAQFTVHVVEPAIALLEANKNFVELKNTSGEEINLSGFALVNHSTNFRIPEGMVVLPNATVRLSSKVTKFRPVGATHLFYPDGVLLASINIAPMVTTPTRNIDRTPSTSPSATQQPLPSITSLVPTVVDDAHEELAAVAESIVIGATEDTAVAIWWWIIGLIAAMATAVTVVILARREREEVLAGYIIEEASDLDSQSRV